jgi:hypothetical protein
MVRPAQFVRWADAPAGVRRYHSWCGASLPRRHTTDGVAGSNPAAVRRRSSVGRAYRYHLACQTYAPYLNNSRSRIPSGQAYSPTEFGSVSRIVAWRTYAGADVPISPAPQPRRPTQVICLIARVATPFCLPNLRGSPKQLYPAPSAGKPTKHRPPKLASFSCLPNLRGSRTSLLPRPNRAGVHCEEHSRRFCRWLKPIFGPPDLRGSPI